MSDEPQIMVVGGRQRGRPRAEVPKSHRTFYLPTAYIDRLSTLALKHGISESQALIQVMDLASRQPRRISEQNK